MYLLFGLFSNILFTISLSFIYILPYIKLHDYKLPRKSKQWKFNPQSRMKISAKTLHYLRAVREQMNSLKQEYKHGMQDFKNNP